MTMDPRHSDRPAPETRPPRLEHRPERFARKPPPGLPSDLVGLNQQLTILHRTAGANEPILRGLLSAWESMQTPDGPARWLALARIAELTLLTAGAYADGCEFRAAGDLLATPAEVRIHLKGRRRPVIKPRHQPISTTLWPNSAGNPGAAWLRDNALFEVRHRALLPLLTEAMAASGRIAAPYREEFATRLEKVAGAIGFLSAWQIEDAADLYARLGASSPGARQFIQANLCRFSDVHFGVLGSLIDRSLRISAPGQPPQSEDPATDLIGPTGWSRR